MLLEVPPRKVLDFGLRKMRRCSVQIIGKEKIVAAGERHANWRKSLEWWGTVTENANWRHFPDVKQTFNSADNPRDNVVIFDISGNKVRLTSLVNYEMQRVTVETIESHAEYDRKG